MIQKCKIACTMGKVGRCESKVAKVQICDGRSAKLQKRSSNISINPSSQQHCAFTFSQFFAPSHISSLPSLICTFPFAFLYLPERVRCDCPYQNTLFTNSGYTSSYLKMAIKVQVNFEKSNINSAWVLMKLIYKFIVPHACKLGWKHLEIFSIL